MRWKRSAPCRRLATRKCGVRVPRALAPGTGGSTGVGNAFAIPHARITGITEPLTAYVRLKAPVDFAAPDRKRVSELFVILVPSEGADEAHLQLLALVAEAFADRAFRARLATASDPQDVRTTFLQWIRAKQAAQTERH